MLNAIMLMLPLITSLPGQSGGRLPIAVVNMPVVSERYQKTADLEARFASIRQQLSARRDEMTNKANLLKRSLQEELRPGTEAYDARLRELVILEAEMKAFVDIETAKVERGLAQALREIYNDIKLAVHSVAESKGLLLVVATDQLPDVPPESARQLREQIMFQKVLYWQPSVDITDEVISALNAKYLAERGSAPAGDTGSGGEK